MGEALRLTLGTMKPTLSPERARFEDLFAQYHGLVWRALRRAGLDGEAAADATQETFAVVLRRLDDIERGKERAFLISTAFQMAHTLRRKTSRWQLEENFDHYRSDDRGAEDASQDVELCDRAMSKLAPELAEVFVLYEIEEFTSPEIAEILDIPVGSVASRLRRARDAFREALEKMELTMKREAK